MVPSSTTWPARSAGATAHPRRTAVLQPIDACRLLTTVGASVDTRCTAARPVDPCRVFATSLAATATGDHGTRCTAVGAQATEPDSA
jgi:hypothetical protein